MNNSCPDKSTSGFVLIRISAYSPSVSAAVRPVLYILYAVISLRYVSVSKPLSVRSLHILSASDASASSEYFSLTCISTGAHSLRLFLSESFIDNAPASTLIVIKSIRHITVVENTIVLILLPNCLSTKLFTPL